MPKTKVEIIYADGEILLVNKPSDLSVTADRSGAAQLVDILADQLGAHVSGQLRLIHRLDKHTSGVMILAKNRQAQSVFSSYFAKRLIRKTYLALVRGPVTARQGRIRASITGDNKKPGQMRITGKRGKTAITEWKLLADFGPIALLAVYPLTGRTHQIRVHLPNAGLPLAIDPLYGNPHSLLLSDFKPNYRLGKNQTEKPLIDRLTLHAYQLELVNPQPNQPDCFIARLDKKFKATIKMLTKNNPKGMDAFIDHENFSKIVNGHRLY